MASTTDLESIISEAIAKYEAETGRKMDLAAVQVPLKTPEDLHANIEQEAAKFTTFRSRRAKLWSRLKSVVGPIAALGGIVSAGVSSAPFGPVVSAVLGSVLYLVSVGELCKGRCVRCYVS